MQLLQWFYTELIAPCTWVHLLSPLIFSTCDECSLFFDNGRLGGLHFSLISTQHGLTYFECCLSWSLYLRTTWLVFGGEALWYIQTIFVVVCCQQKLMLVISGLIAWKERSKTVRSVWLALQNSHSSSRLWCIECSCAAAAFVHISSAKALVLSATQRL